MISDREIIDHLLDKNGTSRRALEDEILEQRRAKIEAEKAEAKARELREEQARVEARDKAIREGYNSIYRLAIDGVILENVDDPRAIPCPYCHEGLPFLRDILDTIVQQHREAVVLYGEDLLSMAGWSFHSWPAYRKDHTCPACGASLAIIAASISPEARELFVETRRRRK